MLSIGLRLTMKRALDIMGNYEHSCAHYLLGLKARVKTFWIKDGVF